MGDAGWNDRRIGAAMRSVHGGIDNMTQLYNQFGTDGPIVLAATDRRAQSEAWWQRIQPRLNLFWAGAWTRGTVQRNRVCFDHELIYHHRGTTTVVLGGRRYVCQAGDVLVKGPGAVEWSHAETSDVQRCTFHFDWDQRGPVRATLPFRYCEDGAPKARDITLTPTWVGRELPHHVTVENMDVRRQLCEFHHHAELLSHGHGAAWLQSEFTQLLIAVMAIGATGTNRALTAAERMVRDVKSELETTFRSEVSIDAVAMRAGVSTSYVTRHFRRITGYTPVAYVMERRLNEAGRLLAQNLSVGEVAQAVGYQDANYFSRVFAKRWGQPPTKFRPHDIRPDSIRPDSIHPDSKATRIR